jgi:hypothetical protein
LVDAAPRDIFSRRAQIRGSALQPRAEPLRECSYYFLTPFTLTVPVLGSTL